MDPLTLGLLAGGISAGGNIFSGFSDKAATEKRNRDLKNQINYNNNMLDEAENRTKRENSSLSQDFLTNYITIRDNEKAAGIRSEYGRAKSDLASTLARLQSERASINSQLSSQLQGTQSTAGIIGGGIMQGVGSGLGAYGAGKQMQVADSMLAGMNGNSSPVSVANEGLFNDWTKVGVPIGGVNESGIDQVNNFDLGKTLMNMNSNDRQLSGIGRIHTPNKRYDQFGRPIKNGGFSNE